jgi:hypothetical protein
MTETNSHKYIKGSRDNSRKIGYNIDTISRDLISLRACSLVKKKKIENHFHWKTKI